MSGEKSTINGVDVAYGLAWGPKKSGKCNVEITTTQGKLFGVGSSKLDGCVSFAAYVSKEADNGIFLWEALKGKWVIVGVTSGILAPGSDLIADVSELEERIEEMRGFVEVDSVFVIGEGDPLVDFEFYDSSNIESGERLYNKKANLKLVLIILILVIGVSGKVGYGMYLDKIEKEKAEIAAQAAAAAEIARKQKLENDIFTLSRYDSPLNNESILHGVYSVHTSYKGWEFISYSYPESKGVFGKTEYSYLNNLVNLFGDKVSWNDKGTKAVIEFKPSRPESPYDFKKENMVYMDAVYGNIYDISLLQRLASLGYTTAFKSSPPNWATSMPSFPEKYNIKYLQISGKTANLRSILNLFNNFGYVVGKILIKNDNTFVIGLAHYMLLKK